MSNRQSECGAPALTRQHLVRFPLHRTESEAIRGASLVWRQEVRRSPCHLWANLESEATFDLVGIGRDGVPVHVIGARLQGLSELRDQDCLVGRVGRRKLRCNGPTSLQLDTDLRKARFNCRIELQANLALTGRNGGVGRRDDVFKCEWAIAALWVKPMKMAMPEATMVNPSAGRRYRRCLGSSICGRLRFRLLLQGFDALVRVVQLVALLAFLMR